MYNPTFKDYITFSRNERNGILVLLFLIILGFGSREIYDHFRIHSIIVVPEVKFADTYESKKDSGNSSKKTYTKQPLIEPIEINKATAEDLQKLRGIGAVLSHRIIKFRDARRGFQKKEDLKQVYGLTSEVYDDIENDILMVVSNRKQNEQRNKKDRKSKLNTSLVPIIVDINKADSATFALLRGIGPVLSGRIVNYRNTIQGFDSLAHLQKVYGIEPELFHNLKPSLTISMKAVPIQKNMSPLKDTSHIAVLNLDINTATELELQKIKGIGPFYSKSIIKLRENLGGFASMEQLKSLYKMEDLTYEILLDNTSIKTPHKTFDINAIEFKKLLSMKILDFEEVKYIFNLKKANGTITSLDQIKNLQGIPPEKIKLLAGYLHF